MSYIRSLCLAFSFAMIGGGVLRLLSPQGSMERTMRMVTGLFIICCIVIPFSQLNHFASSTEIDGMFDETIAYFSQTEISENDEEVFSGFVRKDAEKRLAEEVKMLLKKELLEFSEIKVSLLGSDDNLDQAEVMVFLRSDDMIRKDDIFRLIQSNYPQNVSVVVKLEEEYETVS